MPPVLAATIALGARISRTAALCLTENIEFALGATDDIVRHTACTTQCAHGGPLPQAGACYSG